MAATSKSELLSILEKDWAKLLALLATVSEPEAVKPDTDGISIKDVVGHRAEWIAMYQRWISDGESGRAVEMPAPGYKWNALKPLNAAIRAHQADLDWQGAKALLIARKAELVTILNARDDAALYGGPMLGGNGKWTLGRYGEAVGPSHFRSAAKYIRRQMKASRT